MNSKLYSFIFTLCFTGQAAALQALSDEELGDVSGQALLSVDRFNYEGNNFYQLKMNADVEVNLNVEKLLLKGSDGNAHIDIDNLSLSGDADGISDGNLSSAKLTNPFIELAYKGELENEDAQNREIIGIRIGADNMKGYMSMGRRTDNSGAVINEAGINTFRGYMVTDTLKGTLQTQDSAGGTSTGPLTSIAPRTVSGTLYADACVTVIILGCTPLGETTMEIEDPGIRFASISLGTAANPITLKAGGMVVNTSDGVPVSEIEIKSDTLDLPAIPILLEGEGTAPLLGIDFTLNVVGAAELGSGSDTLRADASIQQELRYIHRAELDGNGFYLSAQSEALKWRGSSGSSADPARNDVAQAGWWMSISKPLDLGILNITNVELPDAALSQIVDKANVALAALPRIETPFSEAIGGALGKTVSVTIGGIPFDSSFDPIQVTLTESQDLGANQNHITNCWNGNISC